MHLYMVELLYANELINTVDYLLTFRILTNHMLVLAYFPKNESEAYEITSLSVCLSVCVPPPPNNF
jgi:hypothetical protein